MRHVTELVKQTSSSSRQLSPCTRNMWEHPSSEKSLVPKKGNQPPHVS